MNGYTLNNITEELKERYPNIEYFTSPEHLFRKYFVINLKDWRYDKDIIEHVEKSLKDRNMTELFKAHKIRIVDIPEDIDWIIQNDEYSDGEYVKENIVVREWH